MGLPDESSFSVRWTEIQMTSRRFRTDFPLCRTIIVRRLRRLALIRSGEPMFNNGASDPDRQWSALLRGRRVAPRSVGCTNCVLCFQRELARERLPEPAADVFRTLQERVGLVLSRATPKKRETGARGNAEEDDCDAGRRPVDEGEVLALGPDLGKRLPIQARVGCVRRSGRTEKRRDETRCGIGLEVPDANQDPAKLVDDGAAGKTLVLAGSRRESERAPYGLVPPNISSSTTGSGNGAHHFRDEGPESTVSFPRGAASSQEVLTLL